MMRSETAIRYGPSSAVRRPIATAGRLELPVRAPKPKPPPFEQPMRMRAFPISTTHPTSNVTVLEPKQGIPLKSLGFHPSFQLLARLTTHCSLDQYVGLWSSNPAFEDFCFNACIVIIR